MIKNQHQVKGQDQNLQW